MSLKTTPKGLLAALAMLCIIVMQAFAPRGGVAQAATNVAAPAHHAVASHPAARPHTQTIGPSASVSAFNSAPGFAPQQVPNSSLTISPTAGPIGVPITVTGRTGGFAVTISGTTSISTNANQPVTITVKDSSGATVIAGTTRSDRTGAYTLTSTLPVTTAFGTASVTSSYTDTTGGTDQAGAAPGPTLNFTVNQPSASIGTTSGSHCVTSTIALTNFVPGVAVTPTLAYSNGAGVTTTVPLSMSVLTPISNGTTSEGDVTGVITIPNSIPYSATDTISISAPYTVPALTGGFPTFTPVTPTLTASAVAPGLATGPFGPSFTVGTTNTVNVSGTNFQHVSGITLTLGISATPTTPGGAVTILPTAAITSDSTGAFTGTALFTPTVAGTYVITASDLNGCNVATATITAISGPVPGPAVSTQYFVEGYTGLGANNGKAGFSTTFDILNPNVSTVVVTNTYMLETINEDITTTTAAPDVVVVTHTLPALADIRVDAATDIASAPVITGPDVGKVLPGTNQKFATEIQTAGFQATGAAAGLGGIVRGVAVQRSMERTLNTGQRADGDTSLGTTAANTSYYFAEGYTGGSFQEYLLLLNPSPTVTATVSVLRVPEGGATTQTPLVDSLVLAPRQRVTLNIRRLNALSAERSIGLIVNSADNPIVAERTEYFGPGNGSAKFGESMAAGMTTAAKQLSFAYGSLTAPVTATDVLSTITPTAELAQTADDRPFIEVINPNIAGQLIAGTFSGSATAPGPAAHVTIQLRGENGRLLGFFFTDIDAGARFTLTYNDLTSSSSGIGFPGVPTDSPTRAGVFSAVVSSSERVVAEEAQYYGQGGSTPSGDANSGAPGIDLVGAPSGETDVLFPSMSVVDPASAFPLARTIFLYNPGVNPTRINGTFFGPSGVVAHQVYTVQPDAIVAIGQNSSYSSGNPVTTTATVASTPAVTTGVPLSIPAGTTGAEFSTIQQRGPEVSGEPARAPETFVAAQVTHSADGSQWWGTQGLYPLPTSRNTPTGQPIPSGCP
jgi:hypothetical protein